MTEKRGNRVRERKKDRVRDSKNEKSRSSEQFKEQDESVNISVTTNGIMLRMAYEGGEVLKRINCSLNVNHYSE